MKIEIIKLSFYDSRFVCMKFGDRVFYPSGIMGKKVHWKRNAQLYEMWKGRID